MKVDLFDFELPPELVALRPVSPRDSARQLIVRPGRRRNLLTTSLPTWPITCVRVMCWCSMTRG
jgi:hypothetical protein